MIRKQLYIEKHHDRALKLRAKALGVTEADVVRQALDAALTERPLHQPRFGQSEALRGLLARATEFASTQTSSLPSTFRREDAYDEERESRWTRRE